MLKNKLLIALLFFTSVVFAQNKTQVIDKVVAVVGDKPILLSDVEKARLQMMSEGISFKPEDRALILDQLIYEYLLIHHAIQDSLEVTDDQVNNKMEANLKFFEQQIGGRDKLEEFYGKTVEQIKEQFFPQIKDKLLSQAMESKITEGLKVTPAEVKKFFESIPVDSLPFINSYVELAQISIIPKVSDDDKRKAKMKLAKIREDIISGASTFCFEAAINSDDPGSASKCGEYDFVRKGQFVKEFDAAAFSLKDGQFSEIFETSYGYHFMQLIQRRGEEYKCRHILIVPKVTNADMTRASVLLDSLYQAIANNQITFEEAALKYSDDAESKHNGGKMINMQTGDTHFDVREIDPQMFILIDKMKVGEVSKPAQYQAPENKIGFRMIKLLKRSNPHRANLNDDYQMIQGAAQGDKERRTVDNWVSSKIPATYIWIDPDYSQFDFKYNWLNKTKAD